MFMIHQPYAPGEFTYWCGGWITAYFDTNEDTVIEAADVWDYDVYSEIGNYEKPVLLMHGDRDGIVPISYAEHAAEVYRDVDYYVISGGGHGFYGNSLDDAFSHILEYLQKIAIL